MADTRRKSITDIFFYKKGKPITGSTYNDKNQDYGAGSIAPMLTKAKTISMKKAKMAKRK